MTTTDQGPRPASPQPTHPTPAPEAPQQPPRLSEVLALARRLRAPEGRPSMPYLAAREGLVEAGRHPFTALMLRQRGSDLCGEAAEATQAGDLPRARELREEAEDVLWALGVMALWGGFEDAQFWEPIVREYVLGLDEAALRYSGVVLLSDPDAEGV